MSNLYLTQPTATLAVRQTVSMAYPPFLANGGGECGKPGIDPDLFLGPDGDGRPGRKARTAAAKAICLRCEHMEECKLWAIRTKQRGVWGGTTEEERGMRKRHGS